MTKTATVSLHGNSYEVDAALVGRKVELVFDPFDLTRIEVRYQHRPFGLAVPLVIGRHTHPQSPESRAPAAACAPCAGIDYLKLLAERHPRERRDAPRTGSTTHPSRPTSTATATVDVDRRPSTPIREGVRL